MKGKAIMIGCCILLASGCLAKKQVVISAPPADPCPMPTGYRLKPAIEVAEQSLSKCPHRLDEAFSRLLDIAKQSPKPENAILIQDMLKRLIKENKISEVYAKRLYQKYFSQRFISIPDVKIYNLRGKIDSIKEALKKELALKKIGMVECCNDKESYEKAKAEFVRAVSFMENLVLNEEYLKSIQ